MTSGLVWFRRDLRLDDNPAWAGATRDHDHVVALYVLDDRLLAGAGPFRTAQLLAELHALDATLREHGGRLRVRHGDPTAIVPGEVRGSAVDGVWWNADVSPYATERDAEVRAALPVPARTPYGSLVLPPGSVHTREGRVARVFGAFHRAWRATPWERWPTAREVTIAGDPGDGLPPGPDRPPHQPGEAAAHDLLQRFLAGPIDRYRADRDRLAESSGSGLSAALRFGTISPRRVVEVVGAGDEEHRAFARQLAWRDWFAHLLAELPDLPHRALRDGFDRIAWRNAPADLAAWQEGRTGYPVVDAGMRQLAQTGTMHNRVRLIAASFLVKDLLIDWRLGERHFRRLLLDGDLAQNVGNWQWVAGTGPDAAPYFRVFNPITQSRTHDPTGAYLRRWLPELAALDDRSIHAPWEAGPLALTGVGVTLGVDYPEPIVDHREARERVLAAYGAVR